MKKHSFLLKEVLKMQKLEMMVVFLWHFLELNHFSIAGKFVCSHYSNVMVGLKYLSVQFLWILT